MNCATDRQSRAVRGPIYALLFVALLACAGGCTSSDAQPAGNKGGRTSKVAAELIALYDEYSKYMASGKASVFKSTHSLVQVIDDRVVIDAVATGEASVLKSDLEGMGMQQAVAYGRIVSGQLPIAGIPRLEEIPSLNFARTAAALLHSRPQSLSPATPAR